MKKKLSKLSAILLIAFLVLSVFTPSIGLIGKVFAESSENLLDNPNLDSDKSGWDGDFVYASNGGENDSGCLQSVNWGAIWQIVELKADTTYTYKFYVGGEGGASRFYVQLDNPYEASGTHVWSSSSTKIGFVEGTVRTTTAGKYWVFLRDYGSQYVTYDSFSLVEGDKTSSENLLDNPNLDSDKSGWDGDFVYASNGGENDSGCLQSVNWGAIWQIVELKADTTYTYKFYVGGEGGASRFYVQLDNPYEASGTHVWSSSSTKIGFVEGTVRTTTAGKYWVFLRDYGSQYVTYDSFSLVEGDKTSGGNEGDDSGNIENYATQTNLTVSDWGTVSIPLAASLEANTTYKWSFKFSLAGGTQNATVTIAGTEVFSGTGFNTGTEKSGEFTTGDTAPTDTDIIFKSSGGGNFQVSELVVKKVDTSVENDANLLENPNLDKNKDGWFGFDYSAAGGENNTGCVQAKNWDGFFQMVTLKENTVYSYGFYATASNAAAKFYIQTSNPWSGGTPVWEGDINGDIYVTGTFSSTTEGQYFFFLRDWGKEFGKFDSFYLIEGTDLSVLIKNGENLLKNPLVNRDTNGWSGENFSSQSGAHGGTKGILLNKGGKIYQEDLFLGNETTYTYSLWVKAISGNTDLKIYILDSETSEIVWQGSSTEAKDNFIDGTFKPQKSGKYKFIIENTGNSDILIDTIAFVKGTKYVKPENGLIPGTEMQPEVTDFHTKKSFVSDSSKNIFKFGGFETTPASGTEWNIETFSGAEGFSIDSEDAYNGNKALKFTGGEEETELRITLPVSMHTKYRLGAWVKGGYLSTEYPGAVYFGIVDAYDEFIGFSQDAEKRTSKESVKTSMARDMRWHRVGFEFYTGDYAEVTFVIRGKRAIMWFDDFVLAESVYCGREPKKVLEAPVVSEKHTTSTPSCLTKDNALAETNLKNADFWNDTIITRETVKVIQDPRNLKNEVLYYNEGDRISNSYYSRNVLLKKNTDYIFTAFYRADVESKASFGLYHRMNDSSRNVFYVSASEPGDWKFITFNFNTKDYEKLVFFIQDNGGNLVLDDVRLFEASKGIALDIDAQLKSMNSALTPLNAGPNNTNNDNTGKNGSDNISKNGSATAEVKNPVDNRKQEEISSDNNENVEANAESVITELRDSATGIRLYYEDGRKIKTTVSFKVDALANEKLPANAIELLDGMKISAYKLALFESGVEVLPNGRVLIEMPLPNAFDGEKCFVYRISDDGKVTNTRAKFEDGKLRFTVDKMGTFAVVQAEETSNMLWIVLGVAIALVLIAGVASFIIIKKKRTKY